MTACKTWNDTSTEQAIETTPESGVAGVLDNEPVVIAHGVPVITSLNWSAGSPPPASTLRVSSLQLTMTSDDGVSPCRAQLVKATFKETLAKDVSAPQDVALAPQYYVQEQEMTISGNKLSMPGAHDIADLYLTFETPETTTCLISAIGHGLYVLDGNANWGVGSGDKVRDLWVRYWGSDRGHRLSHYLWHAMRARWSKLSQSDRQALIARFGALVEPPQRAAQGSPNGEDFFYMHRTMLVALKAFLATKSIDMVPAWDVLPRIGDPNHPTGKHNRWTQAQFDAEEELLRDPAFVKTLTLGEYGDRVERGIHNNMHNRFANSRDLTAKDPLSPDWIQKSSKVFDDPGADSLLSTYSSHVNPVFYRLHGWVDQCIQTWLDAHGYKTIGRDEACRQDKDCYVWLSDASYDPSIDRTPWPGIMPEANSSSGLHLHSHAGGAGNDSVPNLSAKGRALLYETRRMGGFL